MNTKKIQPKTIFTSKGNKEATILSMTNFFDYHFDNGNGKVSYELIGMESTGNSIDESGNITPLPVSAIVLFSSNIDIPSNIVQQWGESDEIIWDYVASQLNIVLVND